MKLVIYLAVILASTSFGFQNQPISTKIQPKDTVIEPYPSPASLPALPVASIDRRNLLAGCLFSMLSLPVPHSNAIETPQITDKVYFTIKGLPETLGIADPKIVIGLFGNQAPKSTAQLKKLFSTGLPSDCRPKAERSLQREQLEANKVYNSCIEGVETPVTLKYSTIWRIIPGLRIDVGAVTGRFVARQFPTWEDSESGLKHNQAGIVSVRRGNDGGFGFSIYMGDGTGDATKDLNQDHIVIGQVIQGMDVVKALNNDIPIINSAKAANYMSLTGGQKTTNAPDRSCRYGGPMYCNENKPLVKLQLSEVGLL